MIKILHFADLHLGMENYGKIDESTGLSSRFLDYLKCFDEIVDFAQKNKVDAVIFAGDAYKNRDPSQTFQREFAKRIYKLSQLQIPTVLIVGNHDLPNTVGKANSLEIFSTLKIGNVFVSKKPEILEIPLAKQQTRPGGGQAKLQVLTLPWVTKKHFLTDQTLYKSNDQLNQAIIEKIKNRLKELYQKINLKYPTIIAAHITVEGATYGSEQQVALGSDVIVPLECLKNKAAQYVALGHLHKKQVLNENPPVIYSGSVERIDFGEEKEDKGFIIAEIDPKRVKKTTYQFMRLPARKFLTIKINIDKDDLNPTATVIKEIKKRNVKDAVIKIIINLSQEQFGQISQLEIQKALKDASFIAQISKETQKENIKKVIFSDEIASMTPIQWLEKYLQDKKEKKENIIKYRNEMEKMLEEIG